MAADKSISVRFRRIDRADDLVGIVEHEARALRRRHPQIVSLAVLVEKRHRRHRTGNPVRAQVSVELRGKVIVSSKRSDDPDESVCAPAAVYRAFHAVEHAVSAYLDRHDARRHGHFQAHLGHVVG
ncbi:MAG: hypothetical protein JXR96_12705 [Deltaproteobacteria bacterium]|nr:hypothetical protein [Deltaproteobacteria bacterium]